MVVPKGAVGTIVPVLVTFLPMAIKDKEWEAYVCRTILLIEAEPMVGVREAKPQEALNICTRMMSDKIEAQLVHAQHTRTQLQLSHSLLYSICHQPVQNCPFSQIKIHTCTLITRDTRSSYTMHQWIVLVPSIPPAQCRLLFKTWKIRMSHWCTMLCISL